VDALRPTLAAISPQLPQRGPYIRFLLISLLMLFIVLYRPPGVLPEEEVVSLTRDWGLAAPGAGTVKARPRGGAPSRPRGAPAARRPPEASAATFGVGPPLRPAPRRSVGLEKGAGSPRGAPRS